MYYMYMLKYNTDLRDGHWHNLLYPRFPIFCSGSITALVFFSLEKYQSNILNFIRSDKIIQLTIVLISLLLGIFLVRRYSFYNWSNFCILPHRDSEPFVLSGVLCFFLFLLLVGSPNCVTDFFDQSQIFQVFGKYSFGVYLFHMKKKKTK